MIEIDMEAMQDAQAYEEQRILVEATREAWVAIRDEILFVHSTEGIRPAKGDSTEEHDFWWLPSCVKAKGPDKGLPLHDVAHWMGFPYPDDFVSYVCGAYRAYKDAEDKLRSMPRPGFHALYPELQAQLDDLYETFRECLRLRAQYGSRQHPACRDMYEKQRRDRRAYKTTCLANGITPANV